MRRLALSHKINEGRDDWCGSASRRKIIYGPYLVFQSGSCCQVWCSCTVPLSENQSLYLGGRYTSHFQSPERSLALAAAPWWLLVMSGEIGLHHSQNTERNPNKVQSGNTPRPCERYIISFWKVTLVSETSPTSHLILAKDSSFLWIHFKMTLVSETHSTLGPGSWFKNTRCCLLWLRKKLNVSCNCRILSDQ